MYDTPLTFAPLPQYSYHDAPAIIPRLSMIRQTGPAEPSQLRKEVTCKLNSNVSKQSFDQDTPDDLQTNYNEFAIRVHLHMIILS
jgi:hypothetical protein